MTLALLALLTLRCADEAQMARVHRQSGTNIRSTDRLCRPVKAQALSGATGGTD